MLHIFEPVKWALSIDDRCPGLKQIGIVLGSLGLDLAVTGAMDAIGAMNITMPIFDNNDINAIAAGLITSLVGFGTVGTSVYLQGNQDEEL